MEILEFIKKILNLIKKLFINGLVTLIPITATIFVIHFTYNLLSRWLIPIKRCLPLKYQLIPALEFALIISAIIFIGLLVKLLIVGPIIKNIEELIGKIPIIKTIYAAAKSLANFFNVPSFASSDKKVVLIQFPREHFYHIAFQLDSAEKDYQPLIPNTQGQKYYKVFMPNSPNPASGYFFIVREDEIIHTNLTFEEAIKAVVSCGIVTPESLQKLHDTEKIHI
ncbi:MAG: hypothetical protein SZ59_C0005G0071 [candidate division TM6 bacterium GW2011_GWF2_28_16]|jgi:uncharacterized membrane protein|nr:MAG: hypothetical protein SZ59_C0005G0071 [candidate division TM6 bacterium GW2011_GWF2_28_16]